MIRKNTIKKSLYQLIDNLEDHLYLLNYSINNVNKNKAFLIVMATELRTLVCKCKGGHEDLLLLISKIVNYELELTLSGPSEIKTTLNKYLNEKCVFLFGRDYNPKEFIKLMCNESGDFAHVRIESNKSVIEGNSLLLGGLGANNRQLLAIARNVSHCGLKLIETLKLMPKEKLDKFNDNYLNS